MKSHSVDRIPAVARLDEYIRTNKGLPPIVIRDIKYVLEGVEKLDQEVKLKATQIATITKQKDGVINNLQQTITSKTSEVQSKNSLLSQKEQLLSELRIKEENQLKEEYISILHQLNPKVFSANYEDWNDKAQRFKDIIDQGKFKTIRKKLPVYKQQLAQKIETEKLAIAAKEAEKLDKAKEEVVSILNKLHPTLYPANFEEWSTHHAAHNSRAKALLDSNNLGAIETKLVHYRGLIKQEVQNKDQLILQKEQDLKILNDTFTTTISTKDEEIITKNQLLAQEIQSKNQLTLQKEMEEKLRIEKEQEIERLKELLAQNEIQTQELLARQELEKQELLIQKENELREKDELLLAKESEIHNKSAEKNRIIEELASNLLTKEEEIVSKNLKIGEVSQSVKKANRKNAAKDKLLIDKEQKLDELKALIEQAKIENEELLTQLTNKSHMKNQIIDELEEEVNLQKDEVVNLRVLNLEKELMTQEQEKLLIQKELELADKSLVKNQLIKESKKLLAEKDNEFQNLLNQNTELVDQNEVLDLKMQYATKEARLRETEKSILLTQKEKLLSLLTQKDYELNNALLQKEIEQKELLIQKEMELADKSLIKNQVIDQLREEIADLNKQLSQNNIAYSIYLDEVGCQPGSSLFEKQLLESLDLSSINLSPIDNGGQNQIVGNILGNFDNQHITHSVVLGGENSESFSIIDAENSH